MPDEVTASGVPTTFVAEYEHGAGDTGGGHGTYLAVFDTATGHRIRDLRHWAERDSSQLSGFRHHRER